MSPNRLLEVRFGYVASRCIGTAVELHLFDALKNGPLTSDQLAQRLACSLRGMRSLCDSLVALELLERCEEDGGDCDEDSLHDGLRGRNSEPS
jgi:hypothetical protein